jgi:hypothetical protein
MSFNMTEIIGENVVMVNEMLIDGCMITPKKSIDVIGNESKQRAIDVMLSVGIVESDEINIITNKTFDYVSNIVNMIEGITNEEEISAITNTEIIIDDYIPNTIDDVTRVSILKDLCIFHYGMLINQ